MGAIISMALVLLVTVGLAVTTIYLLFRFLTNFPPGNSRMKKDLNKLKASIATWFADLVPWDDDEMAQLSLNQINRKIQKGITKTGRGIFTSIYHEPMIAYAFRKYSGGKNHALVYARTSHHEYAFRIMDSETKIWMDNQPLGTLRADGTLLGAKTNRQIARLERPKEELALPVIINNKEVASLAKPENARKVNPRAFELLSPMKKEEEAVLLSMAILEMVKPEINASK